MEVSVVAPSLSLSSFCVFPFGSAVADVLERFVPQQDFYVTRNGRLSPLDECLQHGAVYHLEPRLCGGKGGFGSMLRALGAQIEKTTNREACRDLSGRRLRDVNHEKEMAEWLKKQAEREAEKEQRRLERLQRKLAEPKHQFSDPEYQQQCHDLSERLEDSVLKGLQASSSSQVMVKEVSAAKRPNSGQTEELLKKKKKTTKEEDLDLASMTSVQQLEVLGLDVLKKELMSRGLKCGGTLSERAARLFSVRGLTADQIDPALLAKPKRN
ncbi:splicing regulator SDE2 [Xenentodon cancila]